MANTSDLVSRYYERLVYGKNAGLEARAIAAELNALTYSESGDAITAEDKQKIVLSIYDFWCILYQESDESHDRTFLDAYALLQQEIA